MITSDFTATLLVDQSPKEVFDAINIVRGWWSEEVEGSTNKLHDEFNYHFEDIHRCRLKVTEFVADKKVVWLVMENYFNPGIFNDTPGAGLAEDKSEWTGTKISF